MWYNNPIENAVRGGGTPNGCMQIGVAHLMRNIKRHSPEKQIEAFWSKVAITADDNKCWLWLASRDPKGYGTKQWNGKVRKAHKIAWSLPDYIIPNKMDICHSCDNPSCVNPKHLFLATHQENMLDMVRKGRGNRAKGERNGWSKLTESQVLDIRSRYKKFGDYSALGREYNVHHSTIRRIVLGINWKEIEHDNS